MKSKYLLMVLIIIAFACTNNTTEHNKQPSDQSSEIIDESDNQKVSSEDKKTNNTFWEKLEMVEFKDANGVVVATMPFPSTWKIGQSNNNGASITGPNGIKVTDFPFQSFMINYSPEMQQLYAQSGQHMREMPGIESLIQEDFVPWGQNQGMQLLKYYEIPEVSKIDKWYSDQMFKAMPSRSDVAAFGMDWKKKDGTPYFMILHLNVSTDNAMQYWYYMAAGLEANVNHFETAKKQYIFALANTRFNLEPIMKYNREEAQRAGQSWAAFNQRMAQNQANFDASQRNYVNNSNAINDAIMSGWKEKNASDDRSHERFIDGIREETNVQNTETGQQYKVSAGANQYWMNSNGEYISTEYHDYNPNLDENMNEGNWQELKEVR